VIFIFFFKPGLSLNHKQAIAVGVKGGIIIQTGLTKKHKKIIFFKFLLRKINLTC
jgi:hypothetical protein